MSDINKNSYSAPGSKIQKELEYSLSTQNRYIPNEKVSWTNKIEHNIQEIGEKAKGYKIMHIQESRKIGQTYKHLMLAGIILGPLSGLLSGIEAILYPSDSPVEIPIAAICSGLISGIVISITKYGKFEEKSSHHRIAASKYTSLESNVRRQLLLCRDDRINASQYLEYVGSNFDELFLASPLIAKRIYEDYTKIAKECGIIVPDEYGLTITVDEAYQLKKFNEMKNVSVIDMHEPEDHIEIKIDNIPDTLNTLYTPDKPKNISNEYEMKKRGVLSLEEETFKGTKEVKRNGTFTYFPELNKFSDGRMEYEMERMMGLK